MKSRAGRMIRGGLVAVWAGAACAGTIEERLAALEAQMEQQTSAREEQLLERIDELERQVRLLSRDEVQETAAVPRNPEVSPEWVQRIHSLEDQVSSLTDAQENNPLKDIGLGGYGELHYNGLRGSGGAPNKREVDFHRFVLMVSKSFNERTRFFSELEVEHVMAGAKEKGYVALEQAYIDFDLDDRHTARAGLFLIPVGLLNRTHEPSTFYGVERNPVENQILPTTWFEAGAGMHGQLSDTMNYEAYVHSGLKTSAADAYSVRAGRQKVAYANASDPAATVALSWNVPGITIGGSAQYQLDITQGTEPDPVDAWLGEVHLDAQRGPWGLRMLYAEWYLDGKGPDAAGSDRQFGWYVEPSYRFSDRFGVFTRYNQWDTRAGSGASKSRKEQLDAGVNWWPHEQVVIKADYQWQFNKDGRNQNGVNLGLGYDF